MKIIKCIKHAFHMVVHSRLRSWLTILGIVIGVAAVVAISSIGAGMEESLNSQLGDLGSDILTITPGYSKGSSFMGRGPGGSKDGSSSASADQDELTRTDLQALKGISGIAAINTIIKGNADVTFMGSEGSVSVQGVDQKVWADVTTSEIAKGRMLDSADQNVIVIGAKLAEDYFDDPIGINKMLTIEGNSFRVVGILEDENRNIYMPIQMAYQVLEDKENDVYDSIVIKVKDENQLGEMIEKIEKKLMLVRHVTEKDRDFTLTSNKEMQETRSEMMSSMSAFLTALAAVSLIVGAVGIANTMFTSVLEKTKQVGIMKAIGARDKDIMLIFLFNAAFIGLAGGFLGILLGTALSGFLPALIGGMARNGTLVTPESVITALTVSVLVGVLAGAIPAYKASKLNPVDALRYE